MRLRGERVPEEDQQIQVALGDLCADLLISAQWTALQLIDVDSQLLFKELTGCSCRVEFVMSQ